MRRASTVGRRSRTILRWVLVVAYASITLVGTAITLTGSSDGALGIVATVIFVPMLLVPPALGMVMLVQGDRRPAAYLLAGTLPAGAAAGAAGLARTGLGASGVRRKQRSISAWRYWVSLARRPGLHNPSCAP